MENNIRKNKMAIGKELPLLIKMSIPAILSMIIQSVYNVADSYFVAQMGEKALRAVSMSFTINLIIIAISVGTSVGVSSFISRRLGQGHENRAGEGAITGFILMTISYIIFFIITYFLRDQYYHLFTNDPEVIEMGLEYYTVIVTFAIFVFYQILGEKLLQSTGRMVVPMISHVVSSLINIILDPILINGLYGFPEMGVKGAAIATVFAQFIGFLFIAVYLFFNIKNIGLRFDKFKLRLRTIKEIYEVGLPSILMTSVSALLTFCITYILSGVNEVAVSVNNVFIQLQSIIAMPVIGLGVGLMPLVGYNYGAKLHDRVENFIKYASIISVSIGIFGFLLFQFFGLELFEIFNRDTDFVNISSSAVRILAFSILFEPYSIVTSHVFQGLGDGKYSLYISLVRRLLIAVPLAYILSKIDLNVVWYAFPAGEFLAMVLSFYFYRTIIKRKVESIE